MADADVRKFEYNLHVNLLEMTDVISRKIAETLKAATGAKVTTRRKTRGIESISNELIIEGKAPATVVNSLIKIDGKLAASMLAKSIRDAMEDAKK